VQLKTNTEHTKSLKGIRINDGVIAVQTPTRSLSVQGDIIFTDYGISGDAVFRLSAFIADEIEKGGCQLFLDLLPQYTKEEIYALLLEKQSSFPDMATGELLFGVVNNQVGRAVLRRAANDLKKAASLVKAFPLTVTGSLGFDYAQVTKGGIALNEVDENLESRMKKGLYFAGEILDVDGQCGGFNLQWAYASAKTVADAIHKK
jgi:predicted Rossmann fold flavoprotein